MLKLPSSHPTSIKPHFHLNKNRSLLLCTILPYSQLSRSQHCFSSLGLSPCSLVTSPVCNHQENSPFLHFSMFGDHSCRAQKPIYTVGGGRRGVFLPTVIILEKKLSINVNEWMAPRDKSDSEQSVDWLVQCQSFVLHQWPSQTQEMGVSHCGGGASSGMVRGHRWSEIDAAPKRE